MSEALRKEILLEMRKKRHAYGHEVVAIVDELMTLRKRSALPPGIPDSRHERLRLAASLIDAAQYWGKTPQGRPFWQEVSRALHDNAEHLEEHPDDYTYDC